MPSLKAVHTIVFDFDGVFTDNKVSVDQEGRETVRCDRGDGLAFDLVRAFIAAGWLNAELFVLSKESNPVVQARCRKLKIECKQSIGDKLSFLEGYFADRMPDATSPFEGLVYLGNDLNDLPVMRRAGCAIAPSDAHPRVIRVAHHVLPQQGGNGFVRATIERLLGIDNLSEEKLDELVSHC
ncbi:HAD family hydrolase [Cohaesibacter sp. ES.047]|uniref:KdsC family phosphatase n=1 Tax=Cohaesibacter sp. ES.047 TaxID=1798205 RepID=UPI000BB7FDF6|nr:hypothetical protein [Cohaesibacter sp. ES.047]